MVVEDGGSLTLAGAGTNEGSISLDGSGRADGRLLLVGLDQRRDDGGHRRRHDGASRNLDQRRHDDCR